MTGRPSTEYRTMAEHATNSLKHVSGGNAVCPECGERWGDDDECPECDMNRDMADEPFFSWSACDECGSTLGGDRHPVSGIDGDGDIVHLDVCVDCYMDIAS